jgi:hypothetical protein
MATPNITLPVHPGAELTLSVAGASYPQLAASLFLHNGRSNRVMQAAFVSHDLDRLAGRVRIDRLGSLWIRDTCFALGGDPSTTQRCIDWLTAHGCAPKIQPTAEAVPA